MKHVLLSGALLLSLCASTLAGPPLFNKGGKGGGSKPGFGGGAKPGIGGGAKLKPDRGARAKGVIQHWSKDKIAAARPRDLQIDASGAGFIKDSSKEDTKGKKKGPTALRPYGSLNAQAPPDDHNHVRRRSACRRQRVSLRGADHPGHVHVQSGGEGCEWSKKCGVRDQVGILRVALPAELHGRRQVEPHSPRVL